MTLGSGEPLAVAGDIGGPVMSYTRVMRLQVEVGELRSFGDQVGRSANRLSLSLVIAALIIGSSIVMTVAGGPRLFGLPFFGLAGFIGAVTGGLWLLFSILRSGGGR